MTGPYVATYRPWAVAQVVGAALGSAFVVVGTLTARPQAWPVLVSVPVVCYFVVRTIVMRAELTADALVLRTVVRGTVIPRADLRVQRVPFGLARVRRRGGLLWYDLPLTAATKELLVELRRTGPPPDQQW